MTEASSAMRSREESAASSRCLMRSQLRSSSLVRTSAHEPFSLRPRKVTESFPASMPSRTRASASARSWKSVPPSSGE